MKVAIMQPTYLPWIGYFALMDEVDAFVFLDDVQFDHRSWQHRNRIRSVEAALWLTVPVVAKGRRMQRIDEVLVDSAQPWQRKHLGAILHNYSRAPYLAEHRTWLEPAFREPEERLCDLNLRMIRLIADRLGIRTEVTRSSALRAGGDRVGRLIEICRGMGADVYLSPLGSRGYIERDNRFPNSGIHLLYQHYEHPVYRQIHGGFISHLSALDLLLNAGPESLQVIRSGTRPAFASADLPEHGIG